MTDDDRANFDDLREAVEALLEAQGALAQAAFGLSSDEQKNRDKVSFSLGLARGKLALVHARVTGARTDPLTLRFSDWREAKR
jgi:hypothetical protein